MHIMSDCMHIAVHRWGSNELVLFLVESINGGWQVREGWKESIYLFVDFNIDNDCGLDGT